MLLRPARPFLLLLLAASPALAEEVGGAQPAVAEPTAVESATVIAAEAAPAEPQAIATPQPATAERGKNVAYFWEFDPYYSSVGTEIAIDDRPVPDGGAMSESEVYGALFRESLRPRLLMLEASVYPAPVIGTAIKRHQRPFYDDMVIARADGNELNLIDSVTAGFQEPWAVSAFLGGEMTFTRPGDDNRKGNRGYMGYLVSGGAKHIRDNVLIDDTWWEFEWKLKGAREFRDEKLSWSFRLGVKEHGNPDIRDVAYVGFRRSNLDFNQPVLQFLTNSNVELKTEFARDNAAFMRQEIILGKKVPMKRWRIAPMFEVGLIVEKDAKYTGALANPAVDEVTLLFRPNLEW